MDLSLFFAGTAGSVPTARRGLPAILLRAGGERILLDCGEGTQQQLLRSAGLPELDAIFITHFHLDHWLGLVGMLKTFDLRAREKPLTIYGPPGLKALFATLRPVFGRTGYPLSLVELEPYEEVRFAGYSIGSFPVRHRVEAYGYAFVEDDRPGRFDADAARALGVTEGPDFGRLQRGETVDGVRPEQVVGEDRPGRRIVYSGDTSPVPGGRGARRPRRRAGPRGDLPVRRARPRPRDRPLDRRPGRRDRPRRGVRLLALFHLSTRYFPREIRDEARAVFANTVVPRDFDTIEVPFPERGEPVLVQGRRREPAPA